MNWLSVTTYLMVIVIAAAWTAIHQPALAIEGRTLDEVLEGSPNGLVAREIESYHRVSSTSKIDSESVRPKRFLAISWFERGGSEITRWIVDESGRMHECSVSSFRTFTHQRKELTPHERQLLSRKLDLPDRYSPLPPIERTVVVSCPQGDDWRTHIYDARRLPSAVESIIAILSAINETSE
jgi:hypothetical protein